MACVAEAAVEAAVGASHHSAGVDDMALEEEDEAADDEADDGAWACQTHQDDPQDS